MRAFTLSSAITLLLASNVVATTSSEWEDKELLPFDAIYNGSLTFHETTTSSSGCTTDDSTPWTFYIGSQEAKQYKDETVQRSLYDKNPLFFSGWGKESLNGNWNWILSSTGGDFGNGSATGKVFWDIKATRAGDGWDLSATYVQTTPSSTKANRYSLKSCQKTYSLWKMTPDEGWTLTGHLSPSKLSLQWKPKDWTSNGVNYSWQFGFEGTWDSKSAKLVVGDVVKTEGSNANFNVSSTAQNASSSGTGSGSKNAAAGTRGVWSTVGGATAFALSSVFVTLF